MKTQESHRQPVACRLSLLVILAYCFGKLSSASGHPIEKRNVTSPNDRQQQGTINQMNWRLNFNEYYPFADIFKFGEVLSENSNGLMTWTVIGQTESIGYDVYLATIRNPNKTQNRAIFIDALMVPNEYHTATIATYIMDQLVLNSSYYMDILDNVIFYIVPILNVDSYNLNFKATVIRYQSPHQQLRGIEMGYSVYDMECRLPVVTVETLKNQRYDTSDPSKCSSSYPECIGVSIAHNFPYKWDSWSGKVRRVFMVDCFDTAGNRKVIPFALPFDYTANASIHYIGPGPCSEVECQIVTDFVGKHRDVIDTYPSGLNIYPQAWALPYAYNKDARADNYDEQRLLAAAVVEAMNSAGQFTSIYGHWSEFYDEDKTEVFNGEENPGNPIDWAKSIGIRFTYWAGFGLGNFPRHRQPDLPQVCEQAWRGFQVLARLKDVYGRPVFITALAPRVFSISLSLFLPLTLCARSLLVRTFI